MKAFHTPTHDLQLIVMLPDDYKDWQVAQTGQRMADLFPYCLLILAARDFSYIEEIATDITEKMAVAGFDSSMIR